MQKQPGEREIESGKSKRENKMQKQPGEREIESGKSKRENKMQKQPGSLERKKCLISNWIFDIAFHFC